MEKDITILHIFHDGIIFKKHAEFYEAMHNVKNLYYYYTPDTNFKFQFLQDTKDVIIINNKDQYLKLFSDPQIDVILFYSLDKTRYELFKYIDDKKLVIWWIWGYDIYNGQAGNPPLLPYNKFKERTSEYITSISKHRNYQKPLLSRILSSIINPILTLRKIRNLYEIFKQNETNKKTQIKAVSRIDVVYSPLFIEYDYLKDSCPFIKAKRWRQPTLGNNYKLQVHYNPGNILVNHSLTYSDNHLDVFEYLYRCSVEEKRKYIIPVSYGIDGFNGNPDNLIRLSHFKEGQAIWLTKVLPFDDYTAILNSVTHAIMGILRQQAMGNIFFCLCSGVKLYLFKNSMVYQELKKDGYIVFSIEDDLTQESLSTCLSEDNAHYNYNLFKNLRKSSVEKYRDMIAEEIELKHKK